MKTNLHPTKLIVPTILLAALAGASCAGGPDAEPQSGETALAADGPRGEFGPGPRGFGPGQFADRRVAELTEALDLSDEQAAQIREIFATQAPGRRGARGDSEAHQQARAEMHERIGAVLTPEQRAKLEQLPVEHRLQRMTERLALNEQQVAQVRAILVETHAQAQELRAQGPATPEAREAHRALREQTHERIGAILTPEQRATFDQFPAEPGFGRRGGRGGHGRGGPHGFGGPGGPGGMGGPGCPGCGQVDPDTE